MIGFVENVLEGNEFVIDPEGDFVYRWMGLVALAVAYNVWIIVLRVAFHHHLTNQANAQYFGVVDLVCDTIFVVDFLINFRVAFLQHGLLVKDPAKLSANYRQHVRFRFDVVAMVPWGVAYEICRELLLPLRLFNISLPQISTPVLRLPKLLKWHSLDTFFAKWDSRTSNPNRLRAFKLSMYLAISIHWIGCFYYMLSEFEGFGVNAWVYPLDTMEEDFTSKYIKIMYWSTVTLTTIGGTPNPVTNTEYAFTGMTFLIGVFLFAAVVGNVGDVISNMNASRQEFTTKMDAIKFYMNHRRVPEHLQDRVKKWSDYAWSRTQALDDQTFLDILPPRLRAEIAIHVHLETLKKVKIFEDCEQGLLCELVLKLRSQIFSPGDYICRRGEIGREMFIINHGHVQVVVQDQETQQSMVVANLSEGNYFGEISLLKLDEGQNRRTADVVSLGYSELLCLSKKDLMQALVEYPDAKKVLEKHGRDRMEKNKEAARMQRRKSEATLQVPDASKLLEEGSKDGDGTNDNPGTTTGTGGGSKDQTIKQTAVTGILTRMIDKTKETSELRHIINELRKFDSLATKQKVTELSKRCDDLKTQLEERDAELKRALRRISELESRVAGKLHHGHFGRVNGNHHTRMNLGRLAFKNLRHGGSVESSDNDSSSVWASFDAEDSGPRILITLSSEEKSGSLNSGNGRTLNGRTRTITVPGICLNGVMQQEPSEYQLIGFVGNGNGIYSDDGLEEEAARLGRELLSEKSDLSSRSYLDSSRMSADLTDASCYSDNSIDSDF
ncbi:cyclic nucleotide-gated cation channel alpha-3-like isoform X2 [Lytechinus variegatus]|uniref:cyclic nucleotide-gated cation channel alpha-3-like isoform X2 n=1 Tax=Lytechinus variegatus TaxID=7654 RepID=UPI001BB1B6EA|nr:cyclic nucleotide-gated cation channel alpha-3-like isoform X2 [Lytechinus variegatus]